MFASLLIANRGEIACRVIRTARRLGVRTVAIYSDADAGALHVRLADEARCVGAAPARESYLSIERVVAAARASGADAVHPGYGFLSENAAFAEACAASGLVFVGPPAAAIRSMGSKAEAKTLMERAGVAVVPGYHGADERAFEREAERIGYPILVKAISGGGGRGMRIVRAPAELAPATESAKREAASAFGDDRLLIEKYLDRPRHIEIQVFADRHGHAIHLMERECSIQRRHQKVIEEAPAPGLDAVRRAEMGAAAVAAARAIGYEGAGTVEFIVDRDGRFYFMEMNTRLQVEHPVTELITGLDLVEWQLRVAAGETLPLAQDQVAARGHAIEARLYAEDPARDFLPSPGRLRHLRLPEPDAHVRVDAGVRAGDEVTVHYDPMIAKLAVWDVDRAAAVARLRAALGRCEIVGVANNVAFLSAVAAHPAFASGEIDTGFIARHEAALLPHAPAVPARALALACLRVLLDRRAAAAEAAARSGDPYSPWHGTEGWRLNEVGRAVLRLESAAGTHDVVVAYGRGAWRLALPAGEVAVRGEALADGAIAAEMDGERFQGTAVRAGDELWVFEGGQGFKLALNDPLAGAEGLEEVSGHLAAPMPGKILKVMVRAGDRVARGSALMVMEAMKMEHTIAAPSDGRVAKVNYRAGDQVTEGAELLVLEREEAG